MRPTPDDPSLLGPLRRSAPLIVAAAVAVVAVLAWAYRGDATAGAERPGRRPPGPAPPHHLTGARHRGC
ncbi:hypothetical protein ABT341_29330, partial [Pseudonocardia alni]|uniref:hypothetical protein n=1 Tax=Pseudonocardia alni TaxID=33907 RepID=UPI00332B36A4